MTAVLGKRKHGTTTVAAAAAGPSDPDATAVQDIFRRHFEAQFKPLKVQTQKKPNKPKKPIVEEEDTDEDSQETDDVDNEDIDASSSSAGSDDEWGGLSDDGKEADDIHSSTVQVVDYSADVSATTSTDALDSMTKQERKAYLSSRPPSAIEEPKPKPPSRKKSSNKKISSSSEDPSSSSAPDLLANDLALQRLIEESHLLAGTRVASLTAAEDLKSNRPFATGRLRQKALDLRVQAATHKGAGKTASGALAGASAGSIYAQKSMPMHVRKGIAAAAAARETKRRREAKESGVVLERPGGGGGGLGSSVGKKAAKRLRAVDAPAVGRLRGSELRLTDRDVRAIEGPKKDMRGKKKKKKRR